MGEEDRLVLPQSPSESPGLDLLVNQQVGGRGLLGRGAMDQLEIEVLRINEAEAEGLEQVEAGDVKFGNAEDGGYLALVGDVPPGLASCQTNLFYSSGGGLAGGIDCLGDCRPNNSAGQSIS